MTIAIKALLVLILLAIVVSLASGAVFLIRDRSSSRRTVRALTVRISLSVALFLLVVILVLTGIIEPNDPFRP